MKTLLTTLLALCLFMVPSYGQSHQPWELYFWEWQYVDPLTDEMVIGTQITDETWGSNDLEFNLDVSGPGLWMQDYQYGYIVVDVEVRWDSHSGQNGDFNITTSSGSESGGGWCYLGGGMIMVEWPTLINIFQGLKAFEYASWDDQQLAPSGSAFYDACTLVDGCTSSPIHYTVAQILIHKNDHWMQGMFSTIVYVPTVKITTPLFNLCFTKGPYTKLPFFVQYCVPDETPIPF